MLKFFVLDISSWLGSSSTLRILYDVLVSVCPEEYNHITSCVPLCLTDGYRDYTMAVLSHVGFWHQPSRQRAQGPSPKPRWMPLPALLYASVVKSYRRRRPVDVKHRVVFETREAIEQALAACGGTINTAFVERLNLDIRQRVAAIGRRGNTLCQGTEACMRS